MSENSGERFLRFPTKYDTHEYNIMGNSVESLPLGIAREELIHAIHGRGAFRRFKNGIYYANQELKVKESSSNVSKDMKEET